MLTAVPLFDGRGNQISWILWVLINCQDANLVYLLVIIQIGSSGDPIAGSCLVVATILFLLLFALAYSSSYDIVTVINSRDYLISSILWV
jgi:hypothetical protein